MAGRKPKDAGTGAKEITIEERHRNMLDSVIKDGLPEIKPHRLAELRREALGRLIEQLFEDHRMQLDQAVLHDRITRAVDVALPVRWMFPDLPEGGWTSVVGGLYTLDETRREEILTKIEATFAIPKP